MTDEELIPLYERSNEGDRIEILMALNFSSGTAGPGFLRRVATTVEGYAGYRSVAATSLARRVQSESTATLVECLRDRSTQVQQTAAALLAEYGDDSAAGDFFAWIEKRMKRKSRERNGDPLEVPSLLLYGARHSAVDRVGHILSVASYLAPDELDRLAELGLHPDTAEKAELRGQVNREQLARAAHQWLLESMRPLKFEDVDWNRLDVMARRA